MEWLPKAFFDSKNNLNTKTFWKWKLEADISLKHKNPNKMFTNLVHNSKWYMKRFIDNHQISLISECEAGLLPNKQSHHVNNLNKKLYIQSS